MTAHRPEPDRDRAARALFVSMGLVRRQLRASASPGEVTFPEVAALTRLERGGPATSAELARLEQISPQSMGATLAGLEERGLVARSADPADGRRVVMSVTDAGLQMVGRRRDARVEQIAAALDGFTKTELQQILIAAPLIQRLADGLR
ncbi:MAG: MarR family winged helix-turn-helix transcriptional regulator [Mycobacterium sp.]